MPITNYERHISRNFDLSGRGVSLVRHWFVGGTDDETQAYITALTATTPIYDNLVRESIGADYQGGNNWYMDVRYKNIDLQHVLGGSDPNNPGGPGGIGGVRPQPQGPATASTELPSSFAFDTTGQTARITQSLGTRSKTSAVGFRTTDADETQAAAANYILDNQRAIGISADKVEGCEIYVPKFEWSREVVRTSVDSTYLANLDFLTGRVNNATFYQWQAGEVLYLGANGRQQNGEWNITHRFAVQKNVPNASDASIEIGNGITVAKKRGWDYLWVDYMPGDVNGRVFQIPRSAYVEEVYRFGDFSLIGIGT